VSAKSKSLNDPVAVKHNNDRWWISLADSDLLYWIKGLALGKNLNVDIFEPDVSPLGIQGPKSDELMARVFGDDIRELKFFRHRKVNFNGKEYTVARSGYSVQGGFEVYVDGAENGEPESSAREVPPKTVSARMRCNASWKMALNDEFVVCQYQAKPCHLVSRLGLSW